MSAVEQVSGYGLSATDEPVQLPARPEPLAMKASETALIVVDMQNAYASRGGYLDLAGFDVSATQPVIAKIRQALCAARAAGMQVIFLQNGWDNGYVEAGGPGSPNWHKSNALKTMRKRPELADVDNNLSNQGRALEHVAISQNGDSLMLSGSVGAELQLLNISREENMMTGEVTLDETRIATQMSLVSEVASAYLTLRADQELLRLTSDTLATQKRSYDLTTQLVEAGNSTQLDLRRAEIALRTAEANRAAYTRQAAKDRNALVLLLGQPLTPELSRQLDEAVALPDDIVPTDLPSGLPSELLARRPDIRAAEQMLIGANANIGAARAAFFPTISLTGSAGTASASLDGLFDSGSRAWSFLPQITLPIFRGGALRANLDVAQVQKRIEIANYEKSIQAAFAEVADGLAGKRTLDEQIRSEQLLVAASQKAYQLAEQRFQEGVDDNLTLLDAQRTQYGAQQTLVRTRLTRLNNLIHLYKALGGGWTEHTVQSGATAQQSARSPG